MWPAEFNAPALSLKDMDALSLRNGRSESPATDLVIAIQIGVTGFEPATCRRGDRSTGIYPVHLPLPVL